jgi:flavin reductase (DIM6/NTAB) family NADH-FMN oxidoreductase RutF
MTIDPEQVGLVEAYRLLTACVTPRPIGWISTISPSGVSNLAPYSFFNAVGANPPAVMFSPTNRRDGSKKHSLINSAATGEFVVNIVSEFLVERMNETSREVGYEVSEFPLAGLTEAASIKVRPPRVAEALAALECKVIQVVPVGEGPMSGNLVIGRVVMVHVAESVMAGHRDIDPERLATVGRMGGSLYTRTRDRFELERPG